ncbi:MAG: 4Fe-4S dicluster domain-containing protein [Planctomycetales bacterium]|nr:4Fe-4S dicluster domain-containing protein [Planctomycetales bacterium]
MLADQGYTVLGPKVRDEAIVYEEINGLADLPQGYRDDQQPGRYRVAQVGHNNYFEFNVGPQSWKQFLFPPKLTVGTAERDPASGWTFATPNQQPPKMAFVGVRACELAAIAVQDRVFMQGPYVDPDYRARRESLMLIAVNCTVAAATCFCTSTGTGPKCQVPFDLAFTELEDSFLVEIGSNRGDALVDQLVTVAGADLDRKRAERLQQRAAEQIRKHMDTSDLRDLLQQNSEHPRWDSVASRCLSCTNCTMVCPTCFCSSVHEVSDLTGDSVQRERVWDSCFNIDFSYMADGVVRNSRRSRFRQWLTHKLASWHDQFDSSGCVGCGRCITWCPVGIDLTEEVAAIRAEPSTNRQLPATQPEKTICVVPERARP